LTTIGLIRHGVTEWNENGKAQGVSDIPLNKIGKQQASALASRLYLDLEWDLIVTSDLSNRTYFTAIVARTIPKDIYR